MTTITIPIDLNLLTFINTEISEGNAESKAHIVRYALGKLKDERVLSRIKEAEEDIKSGRVYNGDLRKIISKM